MSGSKIVFIVDAPYLSSRRLAQLLDIDTISFLSEPKVRLHSSELWSKVEYLVGDIPYSFRRW